MAIKLTKTIIKISEFLRESGPARAYKVSEGTGILYNTVNKNLRNMTAAGCVSESRGPCCECGHDVILYKLVKDPTRTIGLTTESVLKRSNGTVFGLMAAQLGA